MKIDGIDIAFLKKVDDIIVPNHTETIAHAVLVEGDGGTVDDLQSLSDAMNRAREDEADFLLLPSSTKTGVLYNQVPEGLDFTVARASTATRTNKDGLVETVGNDTARIDWSDGRGSLLLEPESTNILPQSEDLSSGYNGQYIVTTNQATAPDGQVSADLVSVLTNDLDITVAGGDKLYKEVSHAFGNFANSLYVKAPDATSFDMAIHLVKRGTDVSVAHTVITVTEQWQRVDTSGLISSGTFDGCRLTIKLERDCYVWGVQIEALSYATSYIPTEATTVTRLADEITGAGDVNTFNSEEGVLFVEMRAFVNAYGGNKAITISDGSTSNECLVKYTTATNRVSFIYRNNGVVSAVLNYITSDITQTHKIAIVWKTNRFELWIDSVKVAEDLSGGTLPANTFNIINMSDGGGTSFFEGKIKQLKVFKTALTEAELSTLTSPFTKPLAKAINGVQIPLIDPADVIIPNDISNFEVEYQGVLNEAVAIGAILPTIADQRIQNDRAIAFKANGHKFTDFSSIHCFTESGDFLFQSINWVNPTGIKGTQIGTGALIISDTGITGDDDNYFDTNVAADYSITNCSILWTTKALATAGTALIEAQSAGLKSTAILEQATFQYINTDNTNTNRFITSFATTGTHIITIDTVAEIDISLSGGAVTTVARTSTNVPADTYKLFKNGSSGRGTSKIGMMMIGSNVNGNELGLHNAIENPPAVTSEGGIMSDGYLPLVLSGVYGTYDVPTTTYTFDKTLAEITEGVVVNNVAYNNKLIINEALSVAVGLGATVFDFATVDCFVDVKANQFREQTRVNAIQCSYAGLHIKGTSRALTHLRMQPHGFIAGAIFNPYKVTGMKFSAMTLHGEKHEHDYSIPYTNSYHEFPAGIVLEGAPDMVIDDIETQDFTGDGLTVYHSESRQDDGTPTVGSVITTNLLVQNSSFLRSRRNNISYVDCDGFILDNCILDYAGEGGASNHAIDWRGVLPQCNIDFEATRNRGAACELLEGQIVRNGIIRNNTFTRAWIDDLNFYTCSDIEVHDNTFTRALAVPVVANRLNIHHNTLTYDNTMSNYSFGIYLKPYLNDCILVNENGQHTVNNNTIIGYNYGIHVTDLGSNIYDNIVTNSILAGIVYGGKDTVITNNTITSNVVGSKSYDSPAAASSPENVVISLGTNNSEGLGIRVRNVTALGTGVTFSSVNLASPVSIEGSDNITLTNCTYPSLTQSGSTNITLTNNNP